MYTLDSSGSGGLKKMSPMENLKSSMLTFFPSGSSYSTFSFGLAWVLEDKKEWTNLHGLSFIVEEFAGWFLEVSGDFVHSKIDEALLGVGILEVFDSRSDFSFNFILAEVSGDDVDFLLILNIVQDSLG
jgi:hypothetical protein